MIIYIQEWFLYLVTTYLVISLIERGHAVYVWLHMKYLGQVIKQREHDQRSIKAAIRNNDKPYPKRAKSKYLHPPKPFK